MTNYSERQNKYDYTSLTQATATTDVDIRDTEATAFANRTSTYGIVEITTDETISVKFNSTSMPAITITSSMSPYVREDLAVQNIFISNASGSNAAITIYGNNVG